MKKNKWLKPRKPLNFLLIKPAGPDCNLSCSYCFYKSKNLLSFSPCPHRMTDDILVESLRQARVASTDALTICWQGGEPTLMGLDFFKRALELEERFCPGEKTANALQTNGLLIDKEWARFLKKNDFLVGLSIDGPKHIHDKYRCNAAGHGSWASVIDSAKLLLDEGVSVNALSVITDYSVKFPLEIYEFNMSIGLDHMQFIPCVDNYFDGHKLNSTFYPQPEDLGKFLTNIFDIWYSALGTSKQTFVRFFEDVFFKYMGLSSPDCSLLEECGNYVVIEHNGDVYPCDFFVEDRWLLGNIINGQIKHMLNSAMQNEFGKKKRTLPHNCISCQWLNYCRGGCPKDRLENTGLNRFCQAYKIFFEHADSRFKRLANQYEKP